MVGLKHNPIGLILIVKSVLRFGHVAENFLKLALGKEKGKIMITVDFFVKNGWCNFYIRYCLLPSLQNYIYVQKFYSLDVYAYCIYNVSSC